MSLNIAPLNLMISSRGLTNCLVDLKGNSSETRVILPTNIWAMVTPVSTAGVSEKMVSVATSSDLLGMMKAGNLDLKCLHMGYLMEATAH